MPHITMKTSPTALHMLRLIARATGETQAGVMERLLGGEGKRLRLDRLFRFEGKRLPVPLKKGGA